MKTTAKQIACVRGRSAPVNFADTASPVIAPHSAAVFNPGELTSALNANIPAKQNRASPASRVARDECASMFDEKQ